MTRNAAACSPAVAADARLVTEIEHRLLGNPNIEGIAMRYGFFYGPGTWFATRLNIISLFPLPVPTFCR